MVKMLKPTALQTEPWTAQSSKPARLARSIGWAAVWVSVCGVAGAAEVRLRILETTDIHMNLLSYDYYQDKPTDQ